MDVSALKRFLTSKVGIAVLAGMVCLVVVIGVVLGMSGKADDTQQLASNDNNVIMRESEETPKDLMPVETETVVEQEEMAASENVETVEDTTVSADVADEGEAVVESKVKEKPVKNNGNKNTTPKVEVKEEQVPLAEVIPAQSAPQETSQEKPQASESKPASKPASKPSSSGNNQPSKPEVEKPSVEETKQDEYHLVWMDDFTSDKLNMEDWNYEYHEPGWVNHELQEYVDSEENVYLKDGNLVIQAIKTVDEQGNAYYTSGRVNTQNKHDYKYGRFEARAKVPSGKGFLPAFWMMPTDESFYGQWPKCGEIDIMEVLGDKLTTTHGTLHFGEPHTMRQGGYTLETGDFASEFHVFACEWEPGEIRFYVDGILFYTANDWFTKREGFGEVAYPAPYDQPFYMILNLAVGGDWPGYPDEDAVFAENAQLVVDYVKVYQKDSYDENVKKPVVKVEFREPDTTGNYVLNGDFATAESMSDGKNWEFLLAGTGAATTEISGNTLHVMTTDAGNLDYSVQIVQANQPLEVGYKYRLSFDAYADEARTMITGVTAPDDGYKRYLADTKLELLAGEKKSYSYEFDMLTKSDANGRVEFNLGNQGSTATVHISNVRLEKVGVADIPEDTKTVLPDGNYVYNGQFQEGENRFAYWEVVKTNDDAKVEVTNSNGIRELKASVPSTVTALNQVVVKQSAIAISGGKKYVLSFEAYADGEKTIQTVVAGQTFESKLGTARTTYKYAFETEEGLKGSELSFLLGTEGTIYVDNVRIQEDGMLVNGDFSNGMTGYEVYCHEASKTSYGVDGLKENNAFCMEIDNTGDMDWHIQLKQNNVTLEEGKWYKLSFDAKSTLDRRIMYALQRDGSADDVWTPYSGTIKIDVLGEYQRYSTTFQMVCETDKQTILSISMGAVDGVQLTKRHTVAIDNIVLEEVEEPKQDTPDMDDTTEVELIKNGDFANGDADWVNAITSPGAATADFTQGKAVYTVTNPGEMDWHVQLKQAGLRLEKGATYTVSFKINSSESRVVKYALLNPNANYDWYGGEDLTLTAGVEKVVDNTFTVTEKPTASTIEFVISMGLAGDSTPNSVIEISDISIVRKGAEGTPETPKPEKPEQGEKPAGSELIKNGDFANGDSDWINAITSPGEATADFTQGKAVYTVTNPGEEDWNVQMKQAGLTLENGATYTVSFKINSSESRTVKHALLNPNAGYDWYGGEDLTLTAGEEKIVDYTFTVTEKPTASTIEFVISMGLLGDSTPNSVIEISDISIVRKGTVSTPETPEQGELAGTELIKNGDFANGDADWINAITSPGEATADFTQGKAVYTVTNPGKEDWNIQMKQDGLILENGATYTVSFKITSSESRDVKYALLNPNAGYDWYGGEDLTLIAGEEKVIDYTFTASKPTVDTIEFLVSMGKIGETPNSVIEISEISIIKK